MDGHIDADPISSSSEGGAETISRRTGRGTALRIAALALLACLMLASIVCLTVMSLGYPRLQGKIDPGSMNPAGELSFAVPITQPAWPFFEFPSDGMENPRASSLKVYEDGVLLGPPHAAHVDVAKGGGAFSHWGDDLYFSTSQGDDPRSNGKEYRVVAPYTPAEWIAPALLSLAAFSSITMLMLVPAAIRRSGGSAARRFGAPVLYSVTVAGLVIWIATVLFEFEDIQPIEASKIRAYDGYAYSATITPPDSPVFFLQRMRRGAGSTEAPLLRVTEDGQPLSMPRSYAVNIAAAGGGRYLARQDDVIFSTLDNSDPTLNGRAYAIKGRLGVSGTYQAAVLLLVAASIVLLARRRPGIVFGALATGFGMIGIVGVLSYFDLVKHEEYVSRANVSNVLGDVYSFAVGGAVAPFVTIAPVGVQTSVNVGGEDISCELAPSNLTRMSSNGEGVCAPRAGAQTVDVVFPSASGSDAEAFSYIYPVRVHWYLVVASLAASVLVLLAIWRRPSKRQFLYGAAGLVGAVGALLMAANLAGFFIPLRAPTPLEQVQGIRLLDVPRLSFEDARKQLEWREGDTRDSYARRANQAVYESMIHGDVSDDLGRWRLEIPVSENWLLHILGAMNPEIRKYRYWNHEKEFERGIGLCGHLSSVLVGYLTENSIPARIVGLSGHMVVTVEVEPGVWHLFDPDYGVVMPYSLEEVQSRPDIIDSAYAHLDDAARAGVVNFYTSPADNSIDTSGRGGFYSGWGVSTAVYQEREQLAELLKWVIPSGMIGVSLCLLAALRLGRRRAAGGKDQRRTEFDIAGSA